MVGAAGEEGKVEGEEGGKKERMERRGVRSESMARPTASPEDFAENVPSETDIVIVVVAVIVISEKSGDQQIVSHVQSWAHI